MGAKFNINFVTVPDTDQRLDEWMTYVTIYKANDWTSPGYFIGVWLKLYGNPTPDNVLAPKRMQAAIDIWRFKSLLNTQH